MEINRFILFEKWLKSNDFDNLIYRLIGEHNEEYCEKYYSVGVAPKINNKLLFVFNYVNYKTKPIYIKQFENSNVWLFREYYFQIILNEGCKYRIYNKKDLNLLLEI